MAGQPEPTEQDPPNKAMATLVALVFALSVLGAFGTATWIADDGRDDTRSEETDEEQEEQTDTHDEAG